MISLGMLIAPGQRATEEAMRALQACKSGVVVPSCLQCKSHPVDEPDIRFYIYIMMWQHTHTWVFMHAWSKLSCTNASFQHIARIRCLVPEHCCFSSSQSSSSLAGVPLNPSAMGGRSDGSSIDIQHARFCLLVVSCFFPRICIDF